MLQYHIVITEASVKQAQFTPYQAMKTRGW